MTKGYQRLQPDKQLPLLLVWPQLDSLLEMDPLILLQDLLDLPVHPTLIPATPVIPVVPHLTLIQTMVTTMVTEMVKIVMMMTMIYKII